MSKRSAIKSIRAYCIEVCCAGDLEYVRNCPDGPKHPTPCPLWNFRMGTNPNISEEAREKRRQIALEKGICGRSTSE